MRSAIRILGLVALLLVASNLTASHAAGAHPIRWDFLGERAVSDRLDHDTIHVGPADGRFTKLQIRVKGRAVQFRGVKVHFANGGVQHIELREVIPAGGKSRVIDLQGRARVIQRVDFLYDAQALFGGRAVVRLFGRH